MNSTNKIVVARIRKSIVEWLDTGMSPANVMQSFYNWYAYNSKRTPNHQQAFTKWLQCVPDTINAPFATHEIIEALDTWLEGVPNRRKSPPTSDMLWQKYGGLLFRELEKMVAEQKKAEATNIKGEIQ